MNTYKTLRNIIWIAVILVIIIGTAVFAVIRTPALPVFKESSSRAFVVFDYIRVFGRKIFAVKDIINENISLKEKIISLQGQGAAIESLKSENNALRNALDIKKRFGSEKTIAAGIYGGNPLVEGRWLINRGSDSGIEAGDIVVLESGVLVGRVANAHDGFSTVTAVDDVNIQVTSRVLNEKTTGLAKGLGNGSINFELIIQDDEIKEGDIVISTGDDQYPPGLIIGAVSSVGVSKTHVFKDVKIRPAFSDVRFGKVVVIGQNR
ncbi:MAG: hypothetical protein A3G02_00870 [Candidatus Yanofskybacteria bacterium RIFCSPLOWO2_12_FULL_44_13b]|uniref:Cell shape-determining protein MreC n=1 Tax=Candidatus Yanofskybacteria bacterium RIFCSPLOWO2_02_FULL_44_18 TaxID=1802705 RepID=A0A1F8H164_9BACT|nr:MAG: hypothetical protein A2657_02825 [Candidatus Yanofskybacteria bacterium RIFCSPHIGHO2_01_FULL_44_110b]OGN14124.1 MAG: hypothetical protein A3C01_00825 [Candidatus Yanofskybacteria bacterium RIFCSPHIGHO2_02_FULL_44_36b]OGN19272.1 MAG: hypothetical protein A3F50_03175 [Candidatus Yanofskybacteria bacterium RIFCSPHIGHO2_12_FULL_44_29b]OGN26310.1 MAG: hypothetical protein A3B12_02435 [Candidatus Yanofskybacteria bacterium RIFCSPLOWO2_01_FULL_44_88]OGN30990.1 MAG: hypothetical protein A3I96_0